MKKKSIIISLICMAIIVGIIFLFNSQKIVYTKEYNYLPQYKNMIVDKYEPSKNDQFGNAIYKLKGVDYNDFLNKYEKVLVRDGWKVTGGKKPENIEVTKGEHIAKINAVNSKDYITILIWTK